MTIKYTIKSLDWILLAAVGLLILINFAMLLSGTDGSGGISGLFIRQAVATGIGAAVLLLVAHIPYHTWQRYTPVIYIGGIAGLLIVTLLGTVIRGTVSRLQVFGVQIQPSEFAKIALVVALAWFFARYKKIRWREILLSAIIVMIPAGLVVAEPDIGVATLMLALWAGLMIFQGLPLKHIGVLMVIAAILAGASWNYLLLDYQKNRIRTFLDPTSNPLAEGYNVNQSIIALGSGRLFGRGLGHGPQSQLKFLPERHTDFILASIGEELGFVGIAAVIALYMTILWRLLIITKTTQDTFGQLIAVGMFFIMLVSFTVSTGMNMGILPVTGIPLPLVSYGGSNLVATLLLLGLCQSVWVYSHFKRRPPAEISHFN